MLALEVKLFKGSWAIVLINIFGEMYIRGFLFQLGRYLGRGIFFSPFLSFQESKLTLPAGSPNLKYGAEASCKRVLESNPTVWCRGLVKENTCIQTCAEASCKRIRIPTL
jgi:hypothetical protein